MVVSQEIKVLQSFEMFQEMISRRLSGTRHFRINRVFTWFQWILLYVVIWGATYNVSANALQSLISFLYYVFDHLGLYAPFVAALAALFPTSLHLAQKYFKLEKDIFIKYVVFPSCHSLYLYEACFYKASNRICFRILILYCRPEEKLDIMVLTISKYTVACHKHTVHSEGVVYLALLNLPTMALRRSCSGRSGHGRYTFGKKIKML